MPRQTVPTEHAAQAIGFTLAVNHADADQLTVLHGIGDKIAQALVHERDTNGPFAGPDDLQRVPRIGTKTAQRVGPWLSFD